MSTKSTSNFTAYHRSQDAENRRQGTGQEMKGVISHNALRAFPANAQKSAVVQNLCFVCLVKTKEK